MIKTDLINEILSYKYKLGRFDVCLGTHTTADFTLGYYFDEESGDFKVYKNGERRICTIRYSGNDECEALKTLLRMVKGRALTIAELDKMRDTR